MDDVIKLLSYTYTIDEYGNQKVESTTERQVFCQVNSVGRTEQSTSVLRVFHITLQGLPW